MTRLAVLQSNYLPWKGYFDLINMVDDFVIYDDMQYTTNDWRNRNRIKTPAGLKWLTVPVITKGRFGQAIKDAVVTSPHWRRKHWTALCCNYAGARHFKDYRDLFEELFLARDDQRLSAINFSFMQAICGLLGITTRLTWSMDHRLEGDRNERLVGLCRQLGATHYLSGPAARTYLDEERFARAGITVSYMDYTGYPEYKQQSGPFIHEVSILDLIFNEGTAAPCYMKSFAQ